MERIRLGNNIAISWALYDLNGRVHSLEGKEIQLYVSCGGLKQAVTDYTIQANVISWVFLGADQHKVGQYKLILVEADALSGAQAIDVADAFRLVSEDITASEIGEVTNNVSVRSVLTYSNLVGVESVDVVTSEEDGGTNLISIRLVDGNVVEVPVKNGSKGEKGDNGDKGDTGAKGDKGDTGEQGDKGDKGDTGEQGIQGVSISSVTQPTVATTNGGTNVIRVTLSNGQTFDFNILNGKSSAGFFATSSALSTTIPSPNVGDYAFVSKAADGTFPAYIYVCTTAGTWTATEADYDGDNVDLTPYATKSEVSQLGQDVDYVGCVNFEVKNDVTKVEVKDIFLSKLRLTNIDSVQRLYYIQELDENDNIIGYLYNGTFTEFLDPGESVDFSNVVLPEGIKYFNIGSNGVSLNGTVKLQFLYGAVDAKAREDLSSGLSQLSDTLITDMGYVGYKDFQTNNGITNVELTSKFLSKIKLTNISDSQRLFYIQELDVSESVIGYLYNGTFTLYLNPGESWESSEVVLPDNTKYLNIGSTGGSLDGLARLQLLYGAMDVYLRSVLTIDPNDTKYNMVSENKERLGMFLQQYAKQTVDQYNRIVVSVNGDSILGSQLEEVTPSAEYSTGAFPPNMSRVIVARKIYDAYKLAGEDTIFRNLAHSDWTKSGFAIDNKLIGADFNRFEVYGGAGGDNAVISVSGYKFFKLIWSGKIGYNYSFNVLVSTDGETFVAPSTLNLDMPDTISNIGTDATLQKYFIADVSTISHVKIVLGASNADKAGIWGCEMWNNKRLDVVVQAFSGSIASWNYNNMLNAYCGDYHKPALLITDILGINDTSYINSPNEQYELYEWRKYNALLYQHCIENGIPVLLIRPQFGNDDGNYLYCVGMSRGLAMQFPGFGLIDITEKQRIENTPYSNIVGQDGTHLSDSGILYYFAEIQKIFNP